MNMSASSLYFANLSQNNYWPNFFQVRGPEVEGASELPAFKQETPSNNKMASVSLSFQSEVIFEKNKD